MKLHKPAFGLATGIVMGLCIFICTVWVMLKGGGNTFVLLEQFYVGYSISWAGAFIGLGWGFVSGFIGGWVFALLYNIFAGKCCEEAKERTE